MAKYNLESTWKPIFHRYNALQLQIMAILWILISLPPTVSIMYLIVPLKPQYISSHFKRDLENPSVFAAFALLEIYSKTSVALVDGMEGFHVLVTVYVAICCTDAVRICKSSTRRKIHDYRTLSVLLAAFNSSITKEMLAFICFWGPGRFIFISAFATIRFHGQVSLFEYAPFPIVLWNLMMALLLAVLTTASVGEASEKLFNSIKSEKSGVTRGKLTVREIKSLRKFGVEVSSAKVIERIVILKILYFVLDTLTTGLVTFPKEAIFPPS
ncbi:uncharacterized protein LOC118438836 [Folsomia candida]|uniref:uncharacterized protein LOC118438836 n=1 Tax=Folsomia candida TaxID=158441 RepID=UPI0016054F99|nr:uncharacterized protein LOC118438836 [Folsomia candida]